MKLKKEMNLNYGYIVNNLASIIAVKAHIITY